VAQDDARAVALFTKACDGGDGAGCFMLGTMFRLGEGVRKDAASAASAYARGCALGDAACCTKARP
jgi:uncharacterized protein